MGNRAGNAGDGGRRMKRIRIADVAAQAGVSKTAVSFAFNSPERLNQRTSARIREVAAALGYQPRSRGGARTGASSRTVGLLTPGGASLAFADASYAALCEGASEVVEAAGYGLLCLSVTGGSLERALRDRSVDGILALGLAEASAPVEDVRRSGLPLVLADVEALPEHGSVDSNDEVGARAAVRHLLGLGHRRFAVVGMEPSEGFEGGGPSGSVASRRLSGYRQALQTSGIRLGDRRIVVGPASFDGGVAALNRLWEDGLRPTAILAMSDAMAVGVLRAARELGLSVPGDLSVVGFDDLDLAAHSSPPLTTVQVPVRRKGSEAAGMLLRMIAEPDGARPEHRTLETRLIVRASTAPPAAG